MKNQIIRTEFEMCKVYFKIVMQNVLEVTTETKQVGILLFYDRRVTRLWMTFDMITVNN